MITKCSGMILFMVLFFIPLFMLLGLYALQDSMIEIKMSQAYWRQHHIHQNQNRQIKDQRNLVS